LIEELEEASRGLTAAAVLVGFAAVIFAMLPVVVLLSGASLDSLPPVLTSLAAILTGTKLVAVAWGVVHGAS
jgi:predicted permease